MVERRYWGEHNQYGPFSQAEDGWPHAGEVVRYYRKQKRMSTRQLALNYGEIFGQQLVSERWIQKMEKENMVPQDNSKRRALASLLSIPPVLLGLGSLSELLPKDALAKSSVGTPKRVSVDNEIIASYNKFLNLYWALDYSSTAQHSINDIEKMIAHLNALAPLVTGPTQIQVFELLCGFHPLVSTIFADLCQYDKAFDHANFSVQLADNMGNNKLRSVSLYQRGFVSFEWGKRTNNQQRIAASIADFQVALPLSVPKLEAAILLDLAISYAVNKQGRASDNALNKASALIERGNFADGSFIDTFINLNKGRYNLGVAAVLIALKQYDDAADALFEARDGVGQEQTRRHAWMDGLEAKIYYGQRNYALAVQSATQALKTCKGINSQVNIDLVRTLYSQLLTTNYANSQPMRELGAALILP